MTETEIVEIFLANQWWSIIALVVFVIGVTLCWFGGLMAALTALGNKRWVWGITTIVLGPITGIPYALRYKEAEYARSLMLRGVWALLLGLIMVAAILLLGR
ncbi:hypothetical protein MO867_09705 [Microbulbifer sp. OS29]|uniref:Transmembrane protein n=1 Tax=Microbulbifer okhotskensis TaxID=2926617 RepID=A0A9X2ERX0_9GAMM|nr:hypothetical protein [Microbulbifer okhotskensis]MCO1334613.1 hypothetical protein [Microbulbifer okhotskensis]